MGKWLPLRRAGPAAILAALHLALVAHCPAADESAVKARQVWAEPGTNSLGAPSLDGRLLSFVDVETGDLALFDLASRSTRRLTDNHARGKSGEFAYFSTISPDGRQVAYAWFNEEKFYDLRVVGVDGSKPRLLFRNEESGFVQPCAWSPDGKQILTLFFRKDNISQIALVSTSDGSVRVLKSLNWVYPNKMDLSPDGQHIVYDDFASQGSGQRDIFLLSVDGRREIRLVEHPANDIFPIWTRSGSGILFVSDRSGTMDLWFLALADGRPRGAPVLAQRDLGRILPMGVTRNGAYYYGLRTGVTEVQVAVLDLKTGTVTGNRKLAGRRVAAANSAPEWSPDGRYLAYLARAGNENFGQEFRGIVIQSLEVGAEREVSPNLAFLERLRWSPDGRWFLVSGSDRHGYSGLYLVDARSGDTRPLVRERAATYRGLQGAWSADGAAVFYVREDEGKGPQIRLRQLEGGTERELHRAEAANRLRHLALSPDGQSLAFSSWNRKDKIETLFVLPSAGGAPRPLATVRNAEVQGLEWMRDGNQLLFLTPGKPPAIWRVSFQGGPPQKLNSTLEGSGFRLHPDGRGLALITGEVRSEVWALDHAVPVLRER